MPELFSLSLSLSLLSLPPLSRVQREKDSNDWLSRIIRLSVYDYKTKTISSEKERIIPRWPLWFDLLWLMIIPSLLDINISTIIGGYSDYSDYSGYSGRAVTYVSSCIVLYYIVNDVWCIMYYDVISALFICLFDKRARERERIIVWMTAVSTLQSQIMPDCDKQ